MSTSSRKPGFRDGLRRKLGSGKGVLKQLLNKSHSESINERDSTPKPYSPSDSDSTLFADRPSPDNAQLSYSTPANIISTNKPVPTAHDNSSLVDVYPIQGKIEPEPTASGLLPTPLHDAYTTIIAPRSHDPPAGSTSDILMSGYEGLKTVLRSIERASDIFPPLKSATAGLLSIIDIVEVTSRNKKDGDELERTLRAFLLIINQHVASNQSSPSEPFIRRIEGLSIAINHQITDIRIKKERSLARRVAQGNSDASEIAGIYRTLLYLFQAFTIDTSLSTENVARQILSHTLLDKLYPVPSAEYNAYSPTQRHGCTERTRESILAKLVSWAIDPTDTKIYWLNGMAGTGKTTIAYTFCEILDKLDMLGASFFCSRLDNATASVNRIIPTIAYQLGQRYRSVHNSLLTVIEGDSLIAGKALPIQFRDIIVNPLRAVSEEFNKKVMVITIEALDECSNQDEVQQLLEVISYYFFTLPVKFFITSRPEEKIRQGFNSEELEQRSTKFILHDVEKDIVQADIELYAKERLKKIANSHRWRDGWPPERELKILVSLAGNLFIYASTACSYVAGGNARDRLKFITDTSQNSMAVETAALDELYSTIIIDANKNVNTQEGEDIELILRAVTNLQRPLTISTLAVLFASSIDRIEFSLSSLHSVIHVPSSGSMSGSVSTLHASFPDFITTQRRAGDNYLERSKSHRILALRCLALMDSSLQENTFKLAGQPSNSKINSQMIRERISDGLAYACTYWAFHVAETSVDDIGAADLITGLSRFFDHNVLKWIECLSIIGQLSSVIPTLRRLESRLQTEGEMWYSVMDTRRLITEQFEVVSKYSLQVYGSALAWLPKESRIRKHYQNKYPWNVVVGRRERWHRCEAVLVGHNDDINCVAFSADGGQIVSGSDDKSIRIWNTETGKCEVGLVGHTRPVQSVTFSPDGGRIVSGSDDGTVRIWGVVTGECEATLEGNGGEVFSVAFSPDGSQVVSGSNDGTVRLWDILTGECKAKMVGHLSRVWSVAFRADGGSIVSGSKDKTVRIWDADTAKCTMEIGGLSGAVRSVSFFPDGVGVAFGSEEGKVFIWFVASGKCEAVLEGHTDKVNSVSLTSNGSHIVTGSDDKTVRIWNTITRECMAILEGHSNTVYSVAFSSDGSRVISGSGDNSLRLWNSAAATGESEDIQAGHTATVLSVAFSPDGSRIASGSKDKIILIWSASSGEYEAILAGHSDEVNSVAFSPSGRRILSGSDDNTARIWDIPTGECEVVMEGHTERLWSVAFSPDGLRVVSGSGDNTVRIWSAKTGACEAILVGHLDEVRSVAFSPDGSILASGSDDRTVRFWYTRTGEPMASLSMEGHSFLVFSVAFSPKGDYVVSRSVNEVRIWSVKTKKCEAELVRRGWTVETAVLIGDNTMTLAKRAILPDGSSVYWDSDDLAIIPSQSTPSLYRKGEYIRCTQVDEWCWIPPQFRDPFRVSYHKSKMVLGYESGLVIALEYAPRSISLFSHS